MPIDVTQVPDLSQDPDEASAGWWMQRLANRLGDARRSTRLNTLDAWYKGEPPLPPGAVGAEEAYLAFQRYARSNFAALVSESCRERMQPLGIRTSADGDGTGDAEAWRIWRRAGLPLTSMEVHRTFLRLGECPVIVGPVNPRTGVSTITAEDPRQTVVECDPVDGTEIAALKVFVDDIKGQALAYLYRPGRVDVAVREMRRRTRVDTYGNVIQPRFDPSTWDLAPDLAPAVPPGLMAVVNFRNIDGLAEFEPHLDLLARINHMILQRLVIAVMQAFRQRFAEGLPQKDDQGRVINWGDIFAPGAGAFWALPAGVTLKELGQVDLTPILSAVRDDLKHLAAVSRTPMSMLDPSGENQSAEGAALAREGLVFRAEDRIARATAGWDRVMHAAFLWLADAATTAGDAEVAQKQQERADLNGIDVIWAPPERASLTERAAAAAQAHGAGVPWETTMTDVMQYPPDQVERMKAQRDDDLLFAQQLAQVKAASQAQPAATGGA